jgi:hypothetical protein
MKKLLLLMMLFATSLTYATEARLKAWTIHNRIAGVPPSESVLNSMENAINADEGEEGLENAAIIAMQSDYFYNLVLKNWLKPLSNVERSSRVPLNDFVATMIGAIRDSDQNNKPFKRILYADLVYVGPKMGTDNTDNSSVNFANAVNYKPTSNRHYEEIENRGLSLKNVLVERQQTATFKTETNPEVDAVESNMMVNSVDGSAGILTSRAAGVAYYSAGTNRRVTRYAFMNFMCHDFEDLHDTTRPDFRVRRDVERDPGGDSRTFKSTCVGCHAGQDALGGAFAYYNYEGNRLRFRPGNVHSKFNRNPSYMDGYVTTDDSWINLWATGPNEKLGWEGDTTGNGVRELGEMFSRSDAFPRCMAKKVFKLVCVRPPIEGDSDFIDNMVDLLRNNDFNMKELFSKTIANCIEEEYED